MINFPIDFVFPYVNNKKEQWQEKFKEYCIKTNQESKLDQISKERYDDFGLLKYVLRSINVFAPWINNVFIIVQDKSQIPDWLDQSNIAVVEHSDIIPEQYLPTYNSTTIEMFLGKIKNLNEHFIYSNDDLFFTDVVKPSDFFTEDGKPKILLNKTQIKPIRCQFDNVCLKSYRDVAYALGVPYNTYDFMRPDHSMHPLKLSHIRHIFKLLQTNILSNISDFRTRENYNQYLYINYAYIIRDYALSGINFKLISLENNVDNIIQIIDSKEYQEICLNDVPRTDRQLFHGNIDKIMKAFDKIGLDKKSKFEV